jgi:hypothetical protein
MCKKRVELMDDAADSEAKSTWEAIWQKPPFRVKQNLPYIG